MTRRPAPARKPSSPSALAALERSARKAVELARRTGTPAYVLHDGKSVDATRLPRRKRKKES